MPEQSRRPPPAYLVGLLTFTSGCVDVVTLMALGGVYTSIVTGNLVLVGRAIGTSSLSAALHVVMAVALAWVALTFIGSPSSTHIGVQSFTPWQGHKENAAQIAGLHVGDQTVKVGATTITSIDQLTNILHGSAGSTGSRRRPGSV